MKPSTEPNDYMTLHDYCSQVSQDPTQEEHVLKIRERLGEHATTQCMTEEQRKAFKDDCKYYSHDISETGVSSRPYNPSKNEIQRTIANHWLLMSVRANCGKCLNNEQCNFKRDS